ncbi:DUF5131 family protein [Rhizobium sp. ARZ01]|uniref:DUF5131 family protein n=1 Tax=Rhizobium sp. ARZ01 TaxID=2769313 RepID=UPI002484CB49|nr:DUF5131 family protein [Rhizobium sp. ARZ01]
MAENSKIEWTDHTFNPWIGCTKVSPACDGCYAENLMANRYGRAQWGAGEDRQRTGKANWRKPIAWESTTSVYIKYITDSRYQKFSPEARKWYKPYRCSCCTDARAAAFEEAAGIADDHGFINDDPTGHAIAGLIRSRAQDGRPCGKPVDDSP